MLKRTSYLAAGLLVALVAATATAQAKDSRILVNASHISFAHTPIGRFNRTEVHVTNRTPHSLKMHLGIHQRRDDYTVARLDGKPLDTPLDAGALVGYEVKFTPTVGGIYTGTLAFYPGDLHDYKNGSEQATIATMSATGFTPVQPQLGPGGFALPADLELQITGRFIGGRPVFGSASGLVNDSSKVRTVLAHGRFALRVVNHGPNRSEPILTVLAQDRRLIDHRELPVGLQGPRLRADRDYVGYLPQLAQAGHYDVVVPLNKGARVHSRSVRVMVSGLYDNDTSNSGGYVRIVDLTR